jgi:hypothetical protein
MAETVFVPVAAAQPSVEELLARLSVVTATVPVPLRNLAYWDTATGSWAVEPGEFRLSMGRSSRDLPITATFRIDSAAEPRSAGC